MLFHERTYSSKPDRDVVVPPPRDTPWGKTHCERCAPGATFHKHKLA